MENVSGAPLLNRSARICKPALKRFESSPRPKISNLSDMKRRKKVKFTNSAIVHEARCKPCASSLQTGSALAQNVYEGRTSEYKSFRKLREEAGKKLHYHPPEQEINLKTIEPSKHIVELNKSGRDKYVGSCSILPVSSVMPVAQRSSSLSPAKVLQNSELNAMIRFKYEMSKSLSPILKIAPTGRGSPFSYAKVSQGCGTKLEGIFTKKRDNILKLAAEALSLEMDYFILNRSDMISRFLKRLDTEIKLSNPEVVSKAEQGKSNGIGNLLASSESDGFMELYGTARTELSETNTKKCLGKDYAGAQNIPTWHETGHQFKRREFKWISDLPGEDKSATAVGNTIDFMLTKSDYPGPHNFFSHHHLTNQSLAPFLKTEQGKSNGKGHLLASSKSDAYLEKLFEISRTDFSGDFTKRDLMKDLLPYRCSEADEGDDLIPSSNSEGLLLASSKSDGYPEKLFEISRTNFSGDLTQRNLEKNSLPYRCSEDDDLIPSSKNYVETQVFPTWGAVETGLQSKRRKYKWMLDDGRMSDLSCESKSASAIEWNTDCGFQVIDHRLSKSDYIISDSFPSCCYISNQSIDCSLKSGPENSNDIDHLLDSSKYTNCEELWAPSGTDFSETTVMKPLGKNLLSYRCNEIDELVMPSMDCVELRAFPTGHPLRTELNGKRKYKWIVDDRGISDLPSESELPSDIEWNRMIERNEFGYHTTDHIPNKSNYIMFDDFPLKWQFTNQTLVPVCNSTSLELCESRMPDLLLQPTIEQCTIRLLGWDENTEKDPRSSVCNFPLPSSADMDSLDQPKGGWCIDGYERKNNFDFPLGSNTMIALRDTLHCHDDRLSTLNWNTKDFQNCLTRTIPSLCFIDKR